MYQCTSFYTANRILPQGRDIVVAAWSVTADRGYTYDMAEDTLILPKMYCFIRTIDGSGVIRTQHGNIRLEQNSYIVLPRKEILEYHSDFKIWSYYWVDFIWADGMPDHSGRKMYTEFTEYEKSMFQELLTVGAQHPDEIRYINGIFLHYLFHLYFHSDKREKQQTRSVQFSEVCAYIEQKLYSRLTVQEIADFFNVSTRRIHQIFRENSGLSPKQYVSNLKIEKAKQLLTRTSIPIAGIADVLGYDSPYHFSAVFRKKEGLAPSEFRKLSGGSGESKIQPPQNTEQSSGSGN